MRIERLKLENFIGIRHGLDTDVIEIIFPDNGNVFTSLHSSNGGGKTTILSQLHPFKDSFDDRKELVLPNTIGIKEVDISHNGSMYKIKHVFDKKTSSFISKDGIELNPNGGVRTFEDIVFTELGVSKDYFKIGKIGSNTDNFVQFSTSQRKDYIATLIQDIDKYNEAFVTASDKLKVDNEQLNYIAKILAQIGDASVLKSALLSNKKELEDVEKQILELNQSLAVTDSDLSNINDDISKYDYIKLKTERTAAETSRTQYETVIKTTEKLYQNNDDFKKDITQLSILEKQLEILGVQEAVLTSELESLNNNVIKYQNDKTAAESKLNGFASYSETDSAKTQLETLNAQYREINEAYNTIQDKDTFVKYIDSLSLHLSKYETFMNFILNEYNNLVAHDIDPNRSNIEVFFDANSKKLLQEKYNEIRTKIATTTKCKEVKTTEYNKKCLHIEKFEILKKRPKECSIDTCPFIEDALKYVSLPDEIVLLENDITSLTKTLKDFETTVDRTEDIVALYKQMVVQFKLLTPKQSSNILYDLQRKTYGTIQEILKKSYNEVHDIVTGYKDNVENFITTYNQLQKLKSNIDHYSAIVDKVKNSEELLSHFKSEITNTNANIFDLNEKVFQKKGELAKVEQKKINLAQYITTIQTYLNVQQNLAETAKVLKAINKDITKYEELSNKRVTLRTRLLEDKNSFNSLTTKKQQLHDEIIEQEVNLAKVKEMKKRAAELNKTYANLKLVKAALDPKSGIPLVFIQAYLGQIELIANELLNLAFGGKFEIHFESDPKNFFIRVRSGENIKSDIKLASQGEIALTTISISLALIEQSLGDFNILALDEIDGALDTVNREAFISILSSQVRKLGIEQVFIISHNNAFDSIPMNVILLKGCEAKLSNPEFMKNKTIIYNASSL